MNRCESFFRSSRMAARFAKDIISRNLESIMGQERTTTLYNLIYSPLAQRLNIQEKSETEKIAKQVICTVSRSWFKVDALLDGDAEYAGIDPEVLASKKEAAINSDLIFDNRVPVAIQNEVTTMETAAKKKSYEEHVDFMLKFDPAISTFNEVLEYRTNTTGLMGETILNALHIVSGNNQNISAIRKEVINESLCLQMCDDLVDSVSDYRKKLPNLLYALLLDRPKEKEKFESASINQTILDTKKPYDIVKFYAPNTLSAYLQKFKNMSSTLPKDRKRFVTDSMASMTLLSFSPNATIGKVSKSVVRQMLSRRTNI
jgi:hypothetical protein